MAGQSLLAQTDLSDLAAIESRLAVDYPEAWREIATCLYVMLRGELDQLHDQAVAALALTLAEGLRREIGGSQPYLAKGRLYELSQRDREILDAFNGHNHAELARRWDLTPRQIYDIVARRRQEEFARRQGALPLDGDD